MKFIEVAPQYSTVHHSSTSSHGLNSIGYLLTVTYVSHSSIDVVPADHTFSLHLRRSLFSGPSCVQVQHYSLFTFTWSPELAAYATVHHCYDNPHICRLWNAPANGSCYTCLFNTQFWKLYLWKLRLITQIALLGMYSLRFLTYLWVSC